MLLYGQSAKQSNITLLMCMCVLQGFLGEYTDIRARMHTLGGLSTEEAIRTLRQLVSGFNWCVCGDDCW